MFPLLRVLSCCLTPQRWLPGESLVLAPLSLDGWRRRWFSHVVLASPRGRSRLCSFVGLAAIGPVLAFSRACVLVLSTCWNNGLGPTGGSGAGKAPRPRWRRSWRLVAVVEPCYKRRPWRLDPCRWGVKEATAAPSDSRGGEVLGGDGGVSAGDGGEGHGGGVGAVAGCFAAEGDEAVAALAVATICEGGGWRWRLVTTTAVTATGLRWP
uniref:Uncharacterized protein n=1 Tax=Oryza nivara TaxID=4536 RepID=A0A0E0G5A2_ORYNI